MPPPPRTTVFESSSTTHANETRGENPSRFVRQEILPVVANAGRNREPGIHLELVLDERAHLLLVIDEVHVAGILREPGRQIVCVVLSAVCSNAYAVRSQCGPKGISAERIGVVVKRAPADVGNRPRQT